MKRRLIAMLLVVLMLIPTAGAYTAQQLNTADAMNHLGLFKGTDLGYELDKNLTRVQGTILLIRMLGREAEAKKGSYDMPFSDVLDWAKNYVGFAVENKITNGVGGGKFAPDSKMTDYMFLTLLLRALGYSDKGENALYQWDNPYAVAAQVGLIPAAKADTDFKRADAIEVFWRTMSVKFNGSDETLAQRLIRQGVFTAEEFNEAKEIRANGKPAEDSGTASGSTDSGVSGGDTSGTGSGGSSAGKTYTYEEYQNLPAVEQEAYFNSFASPAEFFAWYNAAKAEYEASQEKVEIGGDGSIDLGDYINGGK